jgi:hypothetical protein
MQPACMYRQAPLLWRPQQLWQVSQLWHVKCMLKNAPPRNLPGGMASPGLFFGGGRGPFRSCSVLTRALSFADAKGRLHPVGRSLADADDCLPALRQGGGRYSVARLIEKHGDARTDRPVADAS